MLVHPFPSHPSVGSRLRLRRAVAAGSGPDPCRLAMDVAARHSGLPAEDVLRAAKGDRRCSAARALGMYLAHVGLGQPMRVVARGFGRHPSTVAYACGRIEERREVAGWDHRVAELENEARRLMADGRAATGDAIDGEAIHDA